MGLDVRRMLALVEVDKSGSLTGAASAMNYTVSAVSQQIAQLEAEAGQPLIVREPRGVSMTEAGHAVVRNAERISRLVAATHQELEELAGLRVGSLRLGTIPTVTESFLPDVISRFRGSHPDIQLSIHSAQLSELSGMFDAREVELAVMWENEASSISLGHDLSTTRLMRDPSYLLVPTDHRLAGRRTVDIGEASDEQWIIRKSPQVLSVLRAACQAAHFEPIASFEARSYQEVQAMVAIGMGVALVPRLSLTGVRHDITALSLGRRAPARHIVLAQRRGERLSPAASAMADVVGQISSAWVSEHSELARLDR